MTEPTESALLGATCDEDGETRDVAKPERKNRIKTLDSTTGKGGGTGVTMKNSRSNKGKQADVDHKKEGTDI